MKKESKAYAQVCGGLDASSGYIEKPNPVLDQDGEFCFPLPGGMCLLPSVKALVVWDPDHKRGYLAKA